MRTLFIGNSHLDSVVRAWLREDDSRMRLIAEGSVSRHAQLHEIPADEPGRDGWRRFLRYHFLDYRPLFVVEDSRIHLAPELDMLIREALREPPSLIVSMIGGFEHSAFGMPRSTVPFEFFDSAHDEPMPSPGTHQVVPAQVVHAWLIHELGNAVQVLRVLRARAPATRIVHVLAPPPESDDTWIANHDEDFVQTFRHLGVTPFMLRLRIYRATCRLMRQMLDELGIECLEPPAAAVAPDGGLVKSYRKGVSHTTPAYGQLVLDQLAGIA